MFKSNQKMLTVSMTILLAALPMSVIASNNNNIAYADETAPIASVDLSVKNHNTGIETANYIQGEQVEFTATFTTKQATDKINVEIAETNNVLNWSRLDTNYTAIQSLGGGNSKYVAYREAPQNFLSDSSFELTKMPIGTSVTIHMYATIKTDATVTDIPIHPTLKVTCNGNIQSDQVSLNIAKFNQDPGQTIQDGNYAIVSVMDQSDRTSIGLAHDIFSDSVNVCLSSQNQSITGISAGYGTAQRWNFKYDYKTDSYTIINCLSNKSLDVRNGRLANYTNIQQYTSNGTAAQKWNIKKNSDNSYTIAVANSNYVLDVLNADKRHMSNIQLYQSNGTSAQRWKLIPISKQNYLEGESLPANITSTYIYTSLGDYVIDVKNASKKDEANIWLYTPNNTKAQKFALKYSAGGNYYDIQNVNSAKMIDVKYGRSKNGTNVWQYKNNGTEAQRWRVVRVPSLETSGRYAVIFINKANGQALDVLNGKGKSGNNVQIWEPNTTKAQVWQIPR